MTDAEIAASGPRKCYGDTAALDGLDLTVRRGTVHGLLGPNGAGKTTAVRIFATLLRFDAGGASVGGTTWSGSRRRSGNGSRSPASTLPSTRR